MIMNESCADCLLRKNLNAYPPEAEKDLTTGYQREVIAAVEEGRRFSAPETVGRINDIYRKYFGEKKDFKQIKSHFNRLMYDLIPEMNESIHRAEDPLKRAVQISMCGNFIDFAALDSVDENQLRHYIRTADEIQIDDTVMESFRHEVMNAQRLVFFTDNCGEIVTDRLLISVMKELNENLNVTVILRGRPVVNDATVEDAAQIHMEETADRIIGNGSNLSGNVLSCISKEALDEIQSADVLISKGQGNFEGLSGCGLNIFYIFMCKCDLFVRRFQVPQFTGIITHE